MGKYMRKSKTRSEVTLLEHTQTESPLGVRTRAKTLALQGGGAYLELRSRRLKKTHVGPPPNLPKPGRGRRTGSGLRVSGSVQLQEQEEINKDGSSCNKSGEASFGENLLDFEPRERISRESTPCSLIRDPNNIETPGSSTRPKNASGSNSRVPDSSRRHIPAAREMNDFFDGAEEEQQKQFIEKYNYDPVNDKPLPGRYEWVKVDR